VTLRARRRLAHPEVVFRVRGPARLQCGVSLKPNTLLPKAFLFDAYGTLFDVHSVLRRNGAGLPGDLQALSQAWRRKQIELTWFRAVMERYEDFWSITEMALRSALQQLSIPAPEPQVELLMQAYLRPAAFDDVAAALDALKPARLAILSNGSPRMLESAVRANGLEGIFASVISVDRVRTYKPSPRVYALGPELLGLPADQILFVSSNRWDAAGAKAFGYRVCWCDRSGAEPEDWGFEPDFTVRRLDEIPSR
jgi:2-haloacid dehalogenase